MQSFCGIFNNINLYTFAKTKWPTKITFFRFNGLFQQIHFTLNY